ncbi:DUF1906 domain-containing protein [Alloscardovia theropitheci]|uniref:DUF1906 domain-containing protein n=1 Tax=Alloscardovia theropitheci TaxID=2496842 RepID=A0A4R0QWJ1_9BIFI|nr:glycoside hydrolase domain-containing protein [Alloscardovia theropitheci]TCD53890.1 DUF1906 domain-containing protein [Alloscardovia theropitheci]
MTDMMVRATQTWLNKTYGNRPGYTLIPEDGNTGWTTIYGLLHALQIELGITATADNFGAGTQSRFKNCWPGGIRQQNSDSKTTNNVYSIIQGALWCKGYSTGAGEITQHFFDGTGAAIRQLKTDMGITGDSTVNLDIMMALLSMDQYKLLTTQGGKNSIRTVQQRINRDYRNFTGLIPTDGLYSRQMNTALIQILQSLEGYSPDDATGNFGSGTISHLKTISAANASANGAWVWLGSAALLANGYGSLATSGWTSNLESLIRNFQAAYAIPRTGVLDRTTWMSLLTSKGDLNRACVACDTRFEITSELLTHLKSDGYQIVGRYLTEPGMDKLNPRDYFKAIRPGELERIVNGGMKFFPIFQENSRQLGDFTDANGRRHAQSASQAAYRLRIPSTVIYFAVDMDIMDYQIDSHIIPYFRAIHNTLNGMYRVGIYASRHVCDRVIKAGLAVSAFVSDMSSGFSGNLGYSIPNSWNYDQFTEISGYHGKWDLDRVAYSGRVPAVDHLLSPLVNPNDDPFYKWVKKTEAECLEAMSGFANPHASHKRLVGKFILEWLRKPEYTSTLWHFYTPELPEPADEDATRELCATICAKQAPIKNTLPTRDIAHFAATALGYIDWGVEYTYDKYGLGDLGGWPLDLIQVWGSYQREGHGNDLSTWMLNNIGQKGVSTGFDYNDVLADADAWLITAHLKDHPDDTSLSDTMKEIFAENENTRIHRFFYERFGGSSENVVEAFASLCDGIDALGINWDFTKDYLQDAAHANSLPSSSQIHVLSEAYANRLANM